MVVWGKTIHCSCHLLGRRAGGGTPADGVAAAEAARALSGIARYDEGVRRSILIAAWWFRQSRQSVWDRTRNPSMFGIYAIWETEDREPMIRQEIQPLLYDATRKKIEALDGQVFEIGGMEDHLHVATSFPPTISVTKFAGEVKGASSFHINHLRDNLSMWIGRGVRGSLVSVG